jgi:hypothetical protein
MVRGHRHLRMRAIRKRSLDLDDGVGDRRVGVVVHHRRSTRSPATKDRGLQSHEERHRRARGR